ncbi:MAG: DNA repair protein RecO [Thermodesulfobacteriota bacterium]
MALHETAAIVLKVLDHGESDKIVTFFTQDFGRLTAIAKGAKRSKIRFVNKLELFSHLQITFADNRFSSLKRVDAAELVNPFAPLRQNYQLFCCASLIAEILLAWLKEQDPDQRIFSLLGWTLEQLCTTSQPQTSLLIFHLHLLSLLGFHLQLDQCQSCASKSGPFFFAPGESAIICQRCRAKGQERTTPLSAGTLKILNRARELPQEKWPRLSFTSQAASEAAAMFAAHTNFHLQRDIHSWQAINL